MPIPRATVALWSALTLLIPLLHGGDVHTAAALFWPWIAFHAGMLVACGWLALRSLHLIRIDREAR